MASVMERPKGNYENIGRSKGLFDIAKKTYSNQYSQIYYARLAAILPVLKEAAQKKWSSSKSTANPNTDVSDLVAVFHERILDSIPDQKCCIMGTVYAELELKPNILKDLAHDLHIIKTETKTKYTGGKMEYFLEDDSGRIELHFEREPATFLCTGVSMAVLGKENEKGVFLVEDYCFCGLEETRPSSKMDIAFDHGYVAFVSGLKFSAAESVKLDLLCDFLSGQCAGFEGLSQRVERVVLAGNVLGKPARIDENPKKKYGVEQAKYDFSSLKLLDGRIAKLAASLPVTLMPGETDPTTVSLPQAPIHQGLFPESSAHSSFESTMNPSVFEMNGVRFVGTSGQNIDDIFRFSDFEDRLSIAENTLIWRNIAPTAPDTLWCFPFYDRDPFVLQSCPDVYFIGNQPAFQSKTLTRTSADGSKVLVVLLPDFSASSCFVLVNTADLTCECVKIDIQQ